MRGCCASSGTPSSLKEASRSQAGIRWSTLAVTQAWSMKATLVLRKLMEHRP